MTFCVSPVPPELTRILDCIGASKVTRCRLWGAILIALFTIRMGKVLCPLCRFAHPCRECSVPRQRTQEWGNHGVKVGHTPKRDCHPERSEGPVYFSAGIVGSERAGWCVADRPGPPGKGRVSCGALGVGRGGPLPRVRSGRGTRRTAAGCRPRAWEGGGGCGLSGRRRGWFRF